ncbi:MAG: HNH/ENDO VII family nuclease [Clostridia bacterium]|nr:HNH/ENDO VII family nuclease [Clostridia bacterium]
MSSEISTSETSEVNESTETNIESDNYSPEEETEYQERVDDVESNLDNSKSDGENSVGDIKENSPYSDEINNYVSSKEELDVYKNANLHEEVYGDPPKHALVRSDIELHGVCDHKGRDNAQRMAEGLSPMTEDGDIIELHHIGQKEDSPLAELTRDEHRGVGNDNVLHDKTKTSEIDRDDFNKERSDYWIDRGAALEYIEDGDY